MPEPSEWKNWNRFVLILLVSKAITMPTTGSRLHESSRQIGGEIMTTLTQAQQHAMTLISSESGNFTAPDGVSTLTMRALERRGLVELVRVDTWHESRRGKFGRHAVKTSRLQSAAVYRKAN